MKIYLISLEQDTHRREQLKARFPLYYDKMEWIPAVYGKNLSVSEYFNRLYPYYIRHHRVMSPSELGCTLSHIGVLQKFVQNDSPYALILEDDVMGNDDDLEKVFCIAKRLGDNCILHCGGHPNQELLKYQLGRATDIEDVYLLHEFSYRFTFGTYAYLVTKGSAKRILEKSKEYVCLADNWDLFFENTNIKFYYTDILKHPEDRLGSHLEQERRSFWVEVSVWKRFFSVDFIWKIFRRIKRELMILYLFMMGYRRVR